MRGRKFDDLTKRKLQDLVNSSASYREILLKIGYKYSTGVLTEQLKEKIKELDIDTTIFDETSYYNGHRFVNSEVFKKNTKASKKTIIRFLKRSKGIPYECSKCGIKEWQGANLSLVLTFKDGDQTNAELDNLEWFCPNCLSQQDDFSRHKKDNKDDNK